MALRLFVRAAMGFGLAQGAAAVAIPGFKTTYEVVTAGAGAQVVAKGSTVTVHATGVVVQTEKKVTPLRPVSQTSSLYLTTPPLRRLSV